MDQNKKRLKIFGLSNFSTDDRIAEINSFFKDNPSFRLVKSYSIDNGHPMPEGNWVFAYLVIEYEILI